MWAPGGLWYNPLGRTDNPKNRQATTPKQQIPTYKFEEGVDPA